MAQVNRTYVHFPGTSGVPAGTNIMLSVFCDIYWMGNKFHVIFFSPFLPDFISSALGKGPLSTACTTCVCHNVRLSPVDTLQAPAHTTSVTVSTMSLQFSANKFLLQALKNRHPSSFPLSFLCFSVTPVLDVCQLSSCQPSPHLSSYRFYCAKTQAA